MSKVLVIIPAYNEEKNLEKLIDKIRLTNHNYDILVVNDCSKDNTSVKCREKNVMVIDLPVNLGIGGAVQTGYKYAYYNHYDIAVQVDGDGQHNPEYIKDIVEEVKNGNNFCIGSRFIDKEGFQSTFMRRVGIKYFTMLIKIVTGFNITDPTSGFRACDRNIIKYFVEYYPQDYPEPETLVLLRKKKYKIKEVAVVMNERDGGKSSISSFKSIYYMIKVTMAILISTANID
ncbi:glycosyltransferase family 2 protein [Clostridium akagii]|uniref:glycosyltransferase family 2 protein n=1 Tax=Clostridium akagii TaxID=91623 RepID=UPI00047E8135|nr:glycosyltransferase family 2 protein [Clostridium akagii]